MLDIRTAQRRDRDAIWAIFHEVVSDGTTYAYPSNISRAEGLHLWMEKCGRATSPNAFDHAEKGLVDAHVMYRRL